MSHAELYTIILIFPGCRTSHVFLDLLLGNMKTYPLSSIYEEIGIGMLKAVLG